MEWEHYFETPEDVELAILEGEDGKNTFPGLDVKNVTAAYSLNANYTMFILGKHSKGMNRFWN